jgi:hypothetical protein
MAVRTQHNASLISLFPPFSSSVPFIFVTWPKVLPTRLNDSDGSDDCVPDIFPCNRVQTNNCASVIYLSAECKLRLKCDGTRAETRFRLSAKRTSPFKSAGTSVQSTAGSRCVRISGSNAGYTMFRGSVKSTGYSLHSPISPSLPLQCVTVCHHVSTGLYSSRIISTQDFKVMFHIIRPIILCEWFVSFKSQLFYTLKLDCSEYTRTYLLQWPYNY